MFTFLFLMVFTSVFLKGLLANPAQSSMHEGLESGDGLFAEKAEIVLTNALSKSGDDRSAENVEAPQDLVFKVDKKKAIWNDVRKRGSLPRKDQNACPSFARARIKSLVDTLEIEPDPKPHQPIFKKAGDPCEGLVRDKHVTCGGPEVQENGGNAILNCVTGFATDINERHRFRATTRVAEYCCEHFPNNEPLCYALYCDRVPAYRPLEIWTYDDLINWADSNEWYPRS